MNLTKTTFLNQFSIGMGMHAISDEILRKFNNDNGIDNHLFNDFSFEYSLLSVDSRRNLENELNPNLLKIFIGYYFSNYENKSKILNTSKNLYNYVDYERQTIYFGTQLNLMKFSSWLINWGIIADFNLQYTIQEEMIENEIVIEKKHTNNTKSGVLKPYIELYYPVYKINKSATLISNLRIGLDVYSKEQLEYPLSLRLNFGVLF
jgi:hypothetical protein